MFCSKCQTNFQLKNSDIALEGNGAVCPSCNAFLSCQELMHFIEDEGYQLKISKGFIETELKAFMKKIKDLLLKEEELENHMLLIEKGQVNLRYEEVNDWFIEASECVENIYEVCLRKKDLYTNIARWLEEEEVVYTIVSSLLIEKCFKLEEKRSTWSLDSKDRDLFLSWRSQLALTEVTPSYPIQRIVGEKFDGPVSALEHELSSFKEYGEKLYATLMSFYTDKEYLLKTAESLLAEDQLTHAWVRQESVWYDLYELSTGFHSLWYENVIKWLNLDAHMWFEVQFVDQITKASNSLKHGQRCEEKVEMLLKKILFHAKNTVDYASDNILNFDKKEENSQ